MRGRCYHHQASGSPSSTLYSTIRTLRAAPDDLHGLRKKRRRSKKYDRIIDAFCEGGSSLVRVDATGRDANYLRMQLKKKIDAKNMSNQVEVSVVNNIAYLEKK